MDLSLCIFLCIIKFTLASNKLILASNDKQLQNAKNIFSHINAMPFTVSNSSKKENNPLPARRYGRKAEEALLLDFSTYMPIRRYGRQNNVKPISIRRYGRQNDDNPMTFHRHVRQDDDKPMPDRRYGRENSDKPMPIDRYGRQDDNKLMLIRRYGRENNDKHMPIRRYGRQKSNKPMPDRRYGRENNDKPMPNRRYGGKNNDKPMPIDRYGRQDDNKLMPIRRYGRENNDKHMHIRRFGRQKESKPASLRRYGREFLYSGTKNVEKDTHDHPRFFAGRWKDIKRPRFHTGWWGNRFGRENVNNVEDSDKAKPRRETSNDVMKLFLLKKSKAHSFEPKRVELDVAPFMRRYGK